MTNLRITTLLLASLLAVAGCKKKDPEHEQGPMESAGEEVDETADEVREDTSEATEEAGDSLEEAGDKIEDKTD